MTNTDLGQWRGARWVRREVYKLVLHAFLDGEHLLDGLLNIGPTVSSKHGLEAGLDVPERGALLWGMLPACMAEQPPSSSTPNERAMRVMRNTTENIDHE